MSLSLLKTSALGSLLLQGGAVLFSFVGSWYIARHLGAAQYGVYAYTFQWAALIGGIVASCYDKLVLRQTAIYTDAQSYPLQKGLLVLAIVVIIGGTLLGIVFCSVVARTHVWAPAMIFYIMLAIPITALTALFQAYLAGMGKTVAARVPDLLVRPAVLCLCLAVIAWYSWYSNAYNTRFLTLYIAVRFNIIAMLAALLVVLAWSWNLLRQLRAHAIEFDWAGWLPQARWFWLSSAVALINVRADILLLGLLTPSNSAEVGIYHVALRLADLLKIPLIALNAVLAPQIAVLYRQQKIGDLQQLVKRHARWSMLVGVGIALGLIGLGIPLLSWWGSDFEAAYIPLCLLCLGQLVNLACGPVGNVLSMTGYVREAFVALLVAAVLGIVAQWLLIPQWGATGAAAASAGGVILWNVLMTQICLRKTTINATVL